MKRIIFITVLLLSVMLCGCGKGQTAGSRNDNRNEVEAVISAGIEKSEEEIAEKTVYSEDTLPETIDNTADAAVLSNSKIDVDLTELSSTMVYSEVYAMMTEPDLYMGKTIKMQGKNSVYNDPTTGKRYYACIIQDATACCEQGIEYQLENDEEYPEADEDVTVIGTLDKYDEDGVVYYTLKNSVLG